MPFFAQWDGDGVANAMFLGAEVMFQRPFSHCRWISDDCFFPVLSRLDYRFIVIFSNMSVDGSAAKSTANSRIVR